LCAVKTRGKSSDKRVLLATAEKVLQLYQETYYDLNMQHFHEKLLEQHGIQLSCIWGQKELQAIQASATARAATDAGYAAPH
jgi:hypothetical protein